MKGSFKVKIIRNYDSKNRLIQDDVKANIQPDVSFFDTDVDIKVNDYVVIPSSEEPYVVEKVAVYDGLPPGHIEAILTPESKFKLKNRGFGSNIDQGTQNQLKKSTDKNVTTNSFTAVDYLNALENAISKSNIPNNDKNNLIKKIQEIKDSPYIENLRTNAIVEVKQIFFG